MLSQHISKASSGKTLSHKDWIKARIFGLLTFYYLPDDADIARAQSAQWVEILAPFERAEIHQAAILWATNRDTKPRPCDLVAIIRDEQRKKVLAAQMSGPNMRDITPRTPAIRSELDAEGRRAFSEAVFAEVGFNPNSLPPRMPSMKVLGHA